MQTHDLAGWEKIFYDYIGSNSSQDDGSHDLGHFQRVWKAADYINREESLAANREKGLAADGEKSLAANREKGLAANREEGLVADPLVLLTAAYFHDLVSMPKNHPERNQSSRLSAERTVLLLQEHFSGFPQEKIEGVRHAIHAHSFSAKVEACTVEAKILQDADRLEAVGAIGLARAFYTAGKLNQKLFDPADPLAIHREPDDRLYSLDHFPVKLLKLPAMMNTRTGRRLAEERADYLRGFLRRIGGEIGGLG